MPTGRPPEVNPCPQGFALGATTAPTEVNQAAGAATEWWPPLQAPSKLEFTGGTDLWRSGACRLHLPSQQLPEGGGTSIIPLGKSVGPAGKIGVAIQVTAFSANWTYAGLEAPTSTELSSLNLYSRHGERSTDRRLALGS